jgi:uncharacterized protein YebE (UPF0316 family)
MNAILIFAIATIVNVTLSTIRSLCTIKGGKWLSAITNAVCYGFYPLIVMLTAKDTVTIWVNMIITAVANFVCVWIIKFIEEKARKDKLWKFEATFEHNEKRLEIIKESCELHDIPYNYIDIGKYYIINFYAKSQEESEIIKAFVECHNGKYFVSESKI